MEAVEREHTELSPTQACDHSIQNFSPPATTLKLGNKARQGVEVLVEPWKV